jgi:hypothetical protein
VVFRPHLEQLARKAGFEIAADVSAKTSFVVLPESGRSESCFSVFFFCRSFRGLCFFPPLTPFCAPIAQKVSSTRLYQAAAVAAYVVDYGWLEGTKSASQRLSRDFFAEFFASSQLNATELATAAGAVSAADRRHVFSGDRLSIGEDDPAWLESQPSLGGKFVFFTDFDQRQRISVVVASAGARCIWAEGTKLKELISASSDRELSGDAVLWLRKNATRVCACVTGGVGDYSDALDAAGIDLPGECRVAYRSLLRGLREGLPLFSGLGLNSSGVNLNRSAHNGGDGQQKERPVILLD